MTLDETGTGRRPTLKDVADAAGVSRATASLVLRGTGNLTDSTRERVRDAMGRLGYVYHRGAASLRAGSTRTIGMIANDSSNLFMGEFTSALELAMVDHGFVTLVCHSYENPERQSLLIRSLLERGVDAIVVVPSVDSGPELVSVLDLLDVPAVVAVRPLAGWAGSFVGPDNVQGGRLAARHLLEHGSRTVAYFGAPLGLTPRHDRLSGLLGESEGPGGALELVADRPGPMTAAAGRAFAEELLADHALPDAIVCHNESLAFGVYRALREHAPELVDRMRVIAFDDVEEAALWEPPLTTLDVNARDVGRRAAEILRVHLTGDRAPQRQTIEPRLVIRRSCGCH